MFGRPCTTTKSMLPNTWSHCLLEKLQRPRWNNPSLIIPVCSVRLSVFKICICESYKHCFYPAQVRQVLYFLSFLILWKCYKCSYLCFALPDAGEVPGLFRGCSSARFKFTWTKDTSISLKYEERASTSVGTCLPLWTCRQKQLSKDLWLNRRLWINCFTNKSL